MAKILARPNLTLGDTPKRLAGPVAGTAAAATLFVATVAPVVTLVQAVRVVNTTAGALTFIAWIGAATGTADAVGLRQFSDTSVPANGVLEDTDEMLMVLVGGEALRWTAPTGLTCTVTGMELTP